MKFNNTVTAMMKIAVVGLLASAGAVAEDTLPTGYTMSFYADYAQGSAIEEGAYDVVIDKLTRKDTRGAKRVTSQVNLCVAYTKAKQIDKATEACDAAVTIAEHRAGRSGSVGLFSTQMARVKENRAIALVNRGVLYAVTGDHEQARQLFELADDLDANVDSAALNLLVLQRELAESDS